MTLKQKIQALLSAANAKTEAGDTDLTGAVQSLIDGYGGGGDDFWSVIAPEITSLSSFFTNAGGAIIPNQDLVFNVPKATSLNSMFYQNKTFQGQDVTINAASATNASNIFRQVETAGDVAVNVPATTSFNRTFDSLFCNKIIIQSDTAVVTDWGAAFLYGRYTQGIFGQPLDVTNMTTAHGAFNYTNTPHVLFKPNTLSANLGYLNNSALDDESLISIANAMISSVAGSVKFSASRKTRCDAITGTVSGGLFVEDPSGMVTLTDFIANTKGWTLT